MFIQGVKELALFVSFYVKKKNLKQMSKKSTNNKLAYSMVLNKRVDQINVFVGHFSD